MNPLNLPPYSPRIKECEGRSRIFDPLRRRYVALTPEEWVRQHFVNFLITDRGYPAGRIGNEIRLQLGKTVNRSDTVVYDAAGEPLVCIEYKAPSVSITQEVFDQVVRYNSVLRVRYLIVSNGLAHYCCRIDYDRGSYEFLHTIPPYDEL